jgi:hypothetical protein
MVNTPSVALPKVGAQYNRTISITCNCPGFQVGISLESHYIVFINVIQCCLQPSTPFRFTDSSFWTYSRIPRTGDRPMARRVPTQKRKAKNIKIYFSVPRGTRIGYPRVCDLDSTGTTLRPRGRCNRRCYVLRIPPTDTPQFAHFCKK